jgi:hypothetical protein
MTPCVLVEDEWGTRVAVFPDPPASFDDDLIVLMWAGQPWHHDGRAYRIAAIDLMCEGSWTRVRVETPRD